MAILIESVPHTQTDNKKSWAKRSYTQTHAQIIRAVNESIPTHTHTHTHTHTQTTTDVSESVPHTHTN